MNSNFKKYETDLLSPKEYLKLDEVTKSNIKNATIIPPKLGSKGFGSIKVQYKSPIYKGNFK